MHRNKRSLSNKNEFPSLGSKIDNAEKIRHYYLKIISCMPNNVYWLDRNCIAQGCNNNILKLLGLSELCEFVGMNYQQMAQLAGWTEGQAESFEKDDREVMETGMGKFNIEELPLYDKKGDPVYYVSSRVPLFDDEGKEVIGVVGISVDITDKKKAEEEIILAKEAAEAASQAKTEFLENMRHDIRTPLSGIVGCARIIQAKPNDPEKVSEYAYDIIQSSEALLNFLNRILEGIKVATGEMPFLKKKFNFKKNIQAILDLNQSFAAKKNLKLTLDVDEKIPPYLVGDPVRLQRIILELVANALRFTQQGGITIQIKLKKQESQQVVIEINISDTGIGIPADKQDEIFSRFTRLTPSHQGIYKGLGLGLSIVKQFVDDLSGEIYVKSHLKQGTTFTCILPFQKPLIMDDVGVEDTPLSLEGEVSCRKKKREMTSDTTDRHHDVNSAQRKVLLVEDDKLAAKIAHSILSELNCVVDIATNAKTALQKIREQDYHLILMDIGLPDMDGISLTHRIRLQQWQQTNITPIVGLTAHIDVENRQCCLDAGMNTVILKPLRKESALELLKAFIPDQCTNQASSFTEGSSITGPILDVDSMKAILKNEELIKDCIHLMMIGLKKELVELPQLYQTANWKAIREIAHRRQGGASYCGAKRLEQACNQLVDYLHEKGPKEQVKGLYQQLLQEMETTKAACEDYIKQ